MNVPTTPPPPVTGDVAAEPVGVGDRLANGAIVLAVKPYPHEGPEAVVFLALSRNEFATWVGKPDGSDTFWGHYFDDIVVAVVDFGRRGA